MSIIPFLPVIFGKRLTLEYLEHRWERTDREPIAEPLPPDIPAQVEFKPIDDSRAVIYHPMHGKVERRSYVAFWEMDGDQYGCYFDRYYKIRYYATSKLSGKTYEMGAQA